jgi:hypothetical protein
LALRLHWEEKQRAARNRWPASKNWVDIAAV